MSTTLKTRADAFRLLYLGFGFPPGVAALHPGINPAGHALETQMVAELRQYFDIRSAGVLPFEPPQLSPAEPRSGIPHELLLVEKAPELFHRFRSLIRLKAQYQRWRAQGWEPETVLVYNLSPIYNQFVLWLRRQARCPRLVLLLLDSPNLGVSIPRFKRFRHRFKPMHVPDGEMIRRFDACVGLSKEVEHYFEPMRLPFLWMPGGCTPLRACDAVSRDPEAATSGPMRLGYFGALAPHAGVEPLIETFFTTEIQATLEICGYGKMGKQVAESAHRDPRIKYHGLLTPSECLSFGRSCDVLINPRPASYGNQNNFSSKLFDYALTGAAILTSRLSGVESVLGPEAFYFDPLNFERSLGQKLRELGAMPRGELRQRGVAIQRRLLSEFSWEKQGARLAQFIGNPFVSKPVSLEAQFLAA
jgi:hypothetical protein